jgi:hypothetical protein
MSQNGKSWKNDSYEKTFLSLILFSRERYLPYIPMAL